MRRASIGRDVLEQLYIDKGLSIEEVAEQLRYNPKTVASALRYHGISIRSKQDYRLEVSRDELEQW